MPISVFHWGVCFINGIVHYGLNPSSPRLNNVTLRHVNIKFCYMDLIWRCLQVYKDSLLITGIHSGPVAMPLRLSKP